MIRISPWLLALVVALVPASYSHACDAPATVCGNPSEGSFGLIIGSQPAFVLTDAAADPAVRRAADGFAADLERISGEAPQRIDDPADVGGAAVIIGVLGKSPIIDGLVDAGRLDPGDLADRWEGFHQEVIERPWPGVAQALVIVGSDRRGAVFGTYDLSEKIGVSPWYWFADVPVEQRTDVYITAGARSESPGIRYRGIFINDEDPAFSSWAQNRFGGVNAAMYEHVFELILRLKGNYLWPAMWYPKAFHLDDPQNRVVADEMGIVMGTSHHEPLTRAQSEWHRIDSEITGGAWDYASNADNLRAFWRGGMERMMAKGDGTAYENLLTIGMRGDGDEPMAEDTAIDLLETIIADQRAIIEDVTGRPAAETPQMWALYKEVQDYYDQGMTVPEDVTLLYADDNWGQIRRLPTSAETRPGGYGVYYHFDYVGVPRNAKWLNTNQIQKVWQQMNLAFERDARHIWVVNVGDIKPMEYPLDFFMKMAWAPEKMTADALYDFPVDWATRMFGDQLAEEVAHLVTEYSRLASRRTPEWLNEDTFPIGDGAGPVLDGMEFGRIVDEWRALVDDLSDVRARIRPEQKSAFFQLVEFPILALSNLYEMYYATAWNRRLASHHDVRANYFLELAEAAYERDAELTEAYHAMEGRKWDGMMSQVHMNYVIWNEPTQQNPPVLTRVSADAPVDRIEINIEFADEPHEQSDAIVIEAARFDRSFSAQGIEWTVIPHLGLSEAAVVALPQGRPSTTTEDGVRLEYDVELDTPGAVRVAVHLSPTLDTRNAGGIRLGVSLAGMPVEILTSTLEPTAGGVSNQDQADWFDAIVANGHVLEAVFDGVDAGTQTLQIWRMDDNVVLERIVLSVD